MVSGMLSILAIALFMFVCDAMRVRQDSIQRSLLQSISLDGFVKAWEDHVSEAMAASPHGLQEACKPKRNGHEGVYKGVVVLFHGYSACPDQFDQMAPLLAQEGYEVLSPLLPGHGNALPDENHPSTGKCSNKLPVPCDLPLDDNTHVPVNFVEYTGFAEEISTIVRLAPWSTSVGEEALHAVAGISVGAAVAAYAGQAPFHTSGYMNKPLYQRQLLINGFFAAPGLVYRGGLAVLGRLSTKHAWLSWGKTCRLRRKHGGRGGFCTMQIKNLETAADFAKRTLDKLSVFGAESGAQPTIQVIYSHRDDVVENSFVRKLVKKFQRKRAHVSSCVLPFTHHSPLSYHDMDYVGHNKWYTQPVMCQSVGFLARGVPFKISERRFRNEGGDNSCDLGCNSATCPEAIFEPGKKMKEVVCQQ